MSTFPEYLDQVRQVMDRCEQLAAEIATVRRERDEARAALANVSRPLMGRELAAGSAGHDIETIREALQRIHRAASGRGGAYMSIPADPRRDADLILAAAIDELEDRRELAAEAGRALAARTAVSP